MVQFVERRHMSTRETKLKNQIYLDNNARVKKAQ